MIRRILRKFTIREISAVPRPGQEGARMTIMKRFDASGQGPTHDKLAAMYDSARRGNPHMTSLAAFAMAWNSLEESERDAIRAEEAATEAAREREAEAARRAERGNGNMRAAEMEKNINIGATALRVLEIEAENLRKSHPDLTIEQAFAMVYADPANREIVQAERRGNRPGAYASDARVEIAKAEHDGAIQKRDAAMDQLMAKAEAYRDAHPELMIEQAFEWVYRREPQLAKAERRASRDVLASAPYS